MNETDLRELYREYDRQSVEAAQEIAQARKDAVGILKGQALHKILRKELGSGDIGKLAQQILNDHAKYNAASKKQALVLAYGRMGGEVSFSLADLCQFVLSLEKTQGKFNNDVQGVPYAALHYCPAKISNFLFLHTKKIRKNGHVRYIYISL